MDNSILMDDSFLKPRPNEVKMKTPEQFAEAVEKGCQLLKDEIGPHWYKRLDMDHFHFSSCGSCVIGQLFKGFVEGLHKLRIIRPEVYGFDAEHHDTVKEENEILEKLWVSKINQLRSGA